MCAGTVASATAEVPPHQPVTEAVQACVANFAFAGAAVASGLVLAGKDVGASVQVLPALGLALPVIALFVGMLTRPDLSTCKARPCDRPA